MQSGTEIKYDLLIGERIDAIKFNATVASLIIPPFVSLMDMNHKAEGSILSISAQAYGSLPIG